MAVRVYLDSILLDSDYIFELTQSETLFGNSFCLGSTLCRCFNLTVAKEAVSAIPTMVYIKDYDGTTETMFAMLHVDSYNSEDDFTYEFTLCDAMIYGNGGYDWSNKDFFSSGSCYLYQIVEDICSNVLGVTAPARTYNGANKEISFYNSTISARSYIGFVAELQGGFARISNAGALEFVPFSNTAVETITLDNCSDFNLGEKFLIDRVGINNGTTEAYKPESATSNITVYLNEDNPFVASTDLQTILNVVNGLTFYTMKIEYIENSVALKTGDLIAITDGTTTWNTIVQMNAKLSSDGWIYGLQLDIENADQQETEIISSDSKIRAVGIKVDRNSNLIDLHGERITDTEQGLEKQSIHFYVDGDNGQCVVSKEGISTEGSTITYPDSRTTFKDDGMRIYVNNTQVAEATASSFNCDKGLGVQKWAIQQGANENILNFFKKG